jgi:hypothetical protein
VLRIKSLLLASAAGSILLAGVPAAVVGQDAQPGLESTVMSEAPATPPPAPERQAVAPGRSYSWLWFPGAVLAYFALQLWILPKMGVPT